MSEVSTGVIRASDIAGSTGFLETALENIGIIALRRLADRNGDGNTTLEEAQAYIKYAKTEVTGTCTSSTSITTDIATEALRLELKNLYKTNGLDYDKDSAKLIRNENVKVLIDGIHALYDIDVPEHVIITSFKTKDYRLGLGPSHKSGDCITINQNDPDHTGQSIVDVAKAAALANGGSDHKLKKLCINAHGNFLGNVYEANGDSDKQIPADQLAAQLAPLIERGGTLRLLSCDILKNGPLAESLQTLSKEYGIIIEAATVAISEGALKNDKFRNGDMVRFTPDGKMEWDKVGEHIDATKFDWDGKRRWHISR